jgi:uncharacterized membrane protein (DUF2068 family)
VRYALIGAWGLWQRKRWGKWVTVVVCALGVLGNIGGFTAGPGAVLIAGLIIGTIIAVGVIVLLFRRDVSALLT